jgi:alpha-glutamyl/putrescinyl thymine pyrophosphorylase clade 1
MMEDKVTSKLQAAKTYEDAFFVLSRYPLHQDFIGMQHLTDLNYSRVINFGEDDFIVPGPGAYRGIQKCFGLKSRPSKREAIELIRACVSGQERFFKLFRLGPVRLMGKRRLHAIDCQNLFCEVDKVARVKHPEFKLKAEERIKQKLKPTGPLPAPFFPPKWNLN